MLKDLILRSAVFLIPAVHCSNSFFAAGLYRRGINAVFEHLIQSLVSKADISGILTGSVHASVTTGDVEMLDGTQTMEGGTKA